MSQPATADSEVAKEQLLTNQQQDQNPQPPGTDREWSHWPTTSPGQTIPGQGNQNPGDQSQKQNPADQDRGQ
jgi:hypothetical protein